MVYRATHRVRMRIGRNHDRRCFGVLANEPGQGREAQCARHVQVQQQQVHTLVLFHLLLQLGDIGRLVEHGVGIQLRDHLLQLPTVREVHSQIVLNETKATTKLPIRLVADTD